MSLASGWHVPREREHRCVTNGAMEHQSILQDALEGRAALLCHAVAGHITCCDDDLEPEKIGILKGPVSHQTDRARRYVPSRDGASHPITEIGSTVHEVDLIEPDSTEIGAVTRCNDKLECRLLGQGRDLRGNPVPCFIQRIVRMAP